MTFKGFIQDFLYRLASRKFLVTIAVQIACVYAFFRPAEVETVLNLAVKIASLATMVLAAFGYGYIEASVDKKKMELKSEETNGTNRTSATEVREPDPNTGAYPDRKSSQDW